MKNMSNEELIADHEDRYIGSGDCTETRAELLRLLDEGERAKEAVEILCYISLDAGIISRGKACEFMGIDRVDLDTKLGEIQLLIAKRNIDLLDFYQNSKETP